MSGNTPLMSAKSPLMSGEARKRIGKYLFLFCFLRRVILIVSIDYSIVRVFYATLHTPSRLIIITIINMILNKSLEKLGMRRRWHPEKAVGNRKLLNNRWHHKTQNYLILSKTYS